MNTYFMELNESEQYDINGGIGIGLVVVVGVIIFVVAAVVTAAILFSK
ncbi:hypothetical protein [Anaeromicropila populeti]|uniref:Class IIb bacteriocin, lactobin A/cerein 7B family n=1 Tax=Anaeromicropila populeti TaxID=37658 RepID=A0A1I6JPX3_9FIRM|nr:hypothetical protein [Anaeromicropila populeti]SFR80993.1 hypothetical protein SAMN05661086_01853 [Anaeromicropila populeti]